MGAAFLFFCCFFALLLMPVVLFLFTFIFRLSCSLCDLPKPTVLAAAGIMLVNGMIDLIAVTVLREVVHGACAAAGVPLWEARIVTWFLGLPVDLAISAGLHTAIMGIKFGKGIEVWFVQRLIQLGIVAAVVGVVAVVVLARGNG